MSLLTLQMPALPDPVKVVLQPARTALLVFDMIDRICKNQPNCTGVMVPALASLLARARKAGVLVLYSTREPESSRWMPEVAPGPGDPIVKSYAQDRFYMRIPAQIGTHSAGKSTLVPIQIGTCSDANRHPYLG